MDLDNKIKKFEQSCERLAQIDAEKLNEKINTEIEEQINVELTEYVKKQEASYKKQCEKIVKDYNKALFEYEVECKKNVQNVKNIIKKELKENYGDEKEKQRKLELLKYQLNEIEQANLKENEEDELNNERKKIMNSEKIYTCLTEVDSNLSESVIDGINLSIRALEKIEDIDDEYKNKLTDLKNIYYDVQELTRDISDLNSDVSFDESKRNEIEERLDCIYDLKRKYGNSISEIIEYKEQIEKDIYTIENLEEHNNKLKKELEDLTTKMSEKCSVLSKMRSKYSKVLNEKINKELKDLEMKNASFHVDIKYDESGNFNQNGLDDIEFLIATNVGDEAKPLIKIASGGEISRIMLAIKTVLADTDEVPILIFDEIDTGISGKAAKSVGEKIKIISQKHQVLCITHQANIAAKGDSNYFISKKVENEKTYTNIKLLNEAEVIEEIARISSGDITKNALEHAREMRLSK